jgi:hypothetical protein
VAQDESIGALLPVHIAALLFAEDRDGAVVKGLGEQEFAVAILQAAFGAS